MGYTPRTIEVIQNQIITQLSAYPLLAPLLPNTSQVAKFTNWTFIIAFAINAVENIWAILQTQIETIASTSAPETTTWIQAQVLAFQYGNFIQVNNNFQIVYPAATAQPLIITNCAVIGDGSGGLIIKVTTASGLLSSAQMNSLLSYLDIILGADINFTVINALPDLLDITGTVYYNGQYAGSIVNNINVAISNYITSLGFNGTIKVSDIIKVIRNTEGVTDFSNGNGAGQLNIWAAPNGSTYPTGGTYLVTNGVINTREYITNSGQIAIDSANPLSASLTFQISND